VTVFIAILFAVRGPFCVREAAAPDHDHEADSRLD
jgi:hypothetical protein